MARQFQHCIKHSTLFSNLNFNEFKLNLVDTSSSQVIIFYNNDYKISCYCYNFDKCFSHNVLIETHDKAEYQYGQGEDIHIHVFYFQNGKVKILEQKIMRKGVVYRHDEYPNIIFYDSGLVNELRYKNRIETFTEVNKSDNECELLIHPSDYEYHNFHNVNYRSILWNLRFGNKI